MATFWNKGNESGFFKVYGVGPTGPAGEVGPAGEAGPTGENGFQGGDGNPGSAGATGSAGSAYYDITSQVDGTLGAGEVFFKFFAGRSFSLSTTTTHHAARCITAPTVSSAVFTISRIPAGTTTPSTFATLTIPVSSTTGTFTITNASNANFVKGDTLTIMAPNPQNATLADVMISLRGSTNES